jgi:sodium-coupled neutral amino acid transporter 11
MTPTHTRSLSFGGCTAYMIVIADVVPNTMEYIGGVKPIRELVLLGIALGIILPVSSLRDMSSLERTSLVSIAASVLMAVVIIARAPAAAASTEYVTPAGDFVVGVSGADQPDAYTFAHADVFHGLGTILMAFVCHHSTFYVFTSMRASLRVPEKWGVVAHLSLGVSCGLGLALGLGGYLSFLGLSQGDVLTNFPTGDGAVNFARLLLGSVCV